jgi:hypothetical protein
VHARILQRQQLDRPVAGQAREIQRLLVHPPGQVVRLGVVGKPAHHLGQLARGGVQVTF